MGDQNSVGEAGASASGRFPSSSDDQASAASRSLFDPVIEPPERVVEDADPLSDAPTVAQSPGSMPGSAPSMSSYMDATRRWARSQSPQGLAAPAEQQSPPPWGEPAAADAPTRRWNPPGVLPPVPSASPLPQRIPSSLPQRTPSPLPPATPSPLPPATPSPLPPA